MAGQLAPVLIASSQLLMNALGETKHMSFSGLVFLILAFASLCTVTGILFYEKLLEE